MPMPEGRVEHVIGVDTHRDSHAAAVLDPTGGLVAQVEIPSSQAGATSSCCASLPSGRRVVAAGRWRGPAATAPDWRASWATRSSGSWSRAGAVKVAADARRHLKALLVTAPEPLRASLCTPPGHGVTASRVSAEATLSTGGGRDPVDTPTSRGGRRPRRRRRQRPALPGRAARSCLRGLRPAGCIPAPLQQRPAP
jgi:hypothetical protein